ncbi:MAG: hypothetical protein HC929_04850 [Leptolyngbyaceae cyanobacterium SM2_5_2]|nr:hypothetical protein [Leptolyngbyaceae cyanobacterium SM2_5_2]
MKLAWPNRRLSRWSRRLVQRISFALAACFLAISFNLPVSGMAPVTNPASVPSLEGPEAGVLVAQDPLPVGRDILNFTTPNYAARVYLPVGSFNPVMNVFRRSAPSRLELNSQPATFRGALTQDGFLTYESFGSRDGRNVIFRMAHNRGTSQARLEILDQATNQVLLSETASGVSAPNMPEAPITGALDRNTLLGFETQNYAVRVFRDPADNIRKMNIFFKPTSQTLVNGQPATPDLQSQPPYECWINYFGGQQFNGVAARYFVRVNAGGQALLDIIGSNGAVLASEPRVNTIPLTTNVPSEDRPGCFTGAGVSSGSALAPFVAAVFGGQRELDETRRVLSPASGQRPSIGLTCVINPRFESAPQGQFINAAECNDRNDAGAVVNFLRARGLNSRLVFRNFRYR